MWTLSRQGDSKSSVDPSYENIGYKTSNYIHNYQGNELKGNLPHVLFQYLILGMKDTLRDGC